MSEAVGCLVEVTFKTPSPLGQEDGMKLWGIGKQFRAMPGKSTYKLESMGEAETLPAAIEGLCAQISEICDQSNEMLLRYRGGSSVKFLRIAAEME
jgi:hypothetical protein